MRKAQKTFLAALVLLLSSGPALADRIDGTWCSPEGDAMTIEGSRVVTPGGNEVHGNYNRHHVDYAVPDGEPNAGGRINADQIDDERIRVTVIRLVQLEPPAHEIWTRCEVIS